MTVRRMGVWQTAFLGDAVLTLPLLQSLARSYPGSEIFYFVRKGLKPLFQADTRYQVLEFDKHHRNRGIPGLFRMARIIRSLDLDLWISPHTSFRSAMITLLTRPGKSIGYSRPLHNRLAYTLTMDRRFEKLDEIERILELLNPLQPHTKEDWPVITLSREARLEAEAFWKENIPGKALGIHPGSTWPTKKWPEHNFSRIISMARDLPDTRTVIFAGPGELDTVDNILSGIRQKDHVINLAGKLSLPELAAFLARLDCYLTNDSGPMHLAWPQRVPTIALFGPTVRQLGFFPRGAHSRVLEVDLSCRPCGLHGHKACPEKHHRCMKDIGPEKVMSHIKEKLHVP